MSKLQINILEIPNQALDFVINGNKIDLNLRTLEDNSMIADLAINEVPEFYGKKCIDRTPLLISDKKLCGNLYFEDQKGTENPNYEGLNERFLLIFDGELI